MTFGGENYSVHWCNRGRHINVHLRPLRVHFLRHAWLAVSAGEHRLRWDLGK
jgi:hypothetical protein